MGMRSISLLLCSKSWHIWKIWSGNPWHTAEQPQLYITHLLSFSLSCSGPSVLPTASQMCRSLAEPQCSTGPVLSMDDSNNNNYICINETNYAQGNCSWTPVPISQFWKSRDLVSSSCLNMVVLNSPSCKGEHSSPEQLIQERAKRQKAKTAKGQKSMN